MMEASGAVKFFIEGVCTGLLGLFGIIGNLVSMAVLSSSELDMMPSFRHLLKMLAAFDATFLVFTLTLFCFSAWSDHYDLFIKPHLLPYLLPIIQVFTLNSKKRGMEWSKGIRAIRFHHIVFLMLSKYNTSSADVGYFFSPSTTLSYQVTAAENQD